MTPEKERAKVTINGQTVSTEPGRLLIDVADIHVCALAQERFRRREADPGRAGGHENAQPFDPEVHRRRLCGLW